MKETPEPPEINGTSQPEGTPLDPSPSAEVKQLLEVLTGLLEKYTGMEAQQEETERQLEAARERSAEITRQLSEGVGPGEAKKMFENLDSLANKIFIFESRQDVYPKVLIGLSEQIQSSGKEILGIIGNRFFREIESIEKAVVEQLRPLLGPVAEQVAPNSLPVNFVRRNWMFLGQFKTDFDASPRAVQKLIEQATDFYEKLEGNNTVLPLELKNLIKN